MKQALEKFHESKEVAEISMYNLLETDVSETTPYTSASLHLRFTTVSSVFHFCLFCQTNMLLKRRKKKPPESLLPS